MTSFNINVAGLAEVSVDRAVPVRAVLAVLVGAVRGLSVERWWALGET